MSDWVKENCIFLWFVLSTILKSFRKELKSEIYFTPYEWCFTFFVVLFEKIYKKWDKCSGLVRLFADLQNLVLLFVQHILCTF